MLSRRSSQANVIACRIKTLEEMETRLRLELERLERENGEFSIALCDQLVALGKFFHLSERYGEALPLLHKRLVIYEKNGPQNKIADAVYDLGVTYRLHRSFNVSEKHLLRALELRTSLFGETNSETGECFNSLAVLYHCQGDFEKAHEFQMKALQLYHLNYKPEDEAHEDIPFEVFKRIRSKNTPSLAQNTVALFKGNLRMEIQSSLLQNDPSKFNSFATSTGSEVDDDRVRSLSENALDDAEFEMETRDEAFQHLSHMKTPEIPSHSIDTAVLPPPPPTPVLDYTTLLDRIDRVRDGKDSIEPLEREIQALKDTQLKNIASKMLQLIHLK